jgi:hypothetical protein
MHVGVLCYFIVREYLLNASSHSSALIYRRSCATASIQMPGPAIAPARLHLPWWCYRCQLMACSLQHIGVQQAA